jgi:glycosyltransferase involved in cell wall biosynthesis
MYFFIVTKYRKAHLFIITNPPFAIFITLFLRNNYSLLIYDVYPDALVQYKIFKEKSFIVKYWKKLNSKVFLKANRIFTISEGMSELIASYVSKNRIEVVPIWTDAEFLKPLPKDENLFLKQLDLTGKFLIQYSGNLGRTHDVEVLVELAKEFKDVSNVFFLIVGEGDKKKIIEEKIKEYQLSNCLLLPWQPVEMLPYSLSAPDLGVVTLGSEASNLSVPSKTFNLMSVQVPILAIADNDSELSRIIQKYSIGNSFSKNQLSEMKEYILDLVNNPFKLIKLKENALIASKDFTKENADLFL